MESKCPDETLIEDTFSLNEAHIFLVRRTMSAIFYILLYSKGTPFRLIFLLQQLLYSTCVEAVTLPRSSIWCCYQMSRNVRKRTFSHERPTKTQISLRIRTVWSEPSLSAWRNFASLAIQNAASEDSDQTARKRRLIWNFAGRPCPKVGFLTLGLACFGHLRLLSSFMKTENRVRQKILLGDARIITKFL